MAPITRKRKRRSCSCSCSSPEAGWSTLPDLLLDLIISKLTSSLKDCLAFAATCHHWRSAAKQFKINANLLMPITTTTTFAAVRVFHDVSTATPRQFHLNLPAIRGFTAFGSRFGWLVAFRARDKFLRSRIMLFHPLSRASIPLPDFESLVLNAVLTATPGDPDCAVVVEYGPGKLAFAKPGHDVVWHRVHTDFHVRGFVCLNKSFLYCLRWLQDSDSYSILKYDMSFHPHSAPPLLIAPPPQLMNHHHHQDPTSVRLVSMTRHLVLMEKRRVPTPNYMTCHLLDMQGQLCILVKFFTHKVNSFIEIFKLEAHTEEWTQVESLGNLCLVIQDKVNLSLIDATEDPKLIPGCIYYPNTDEVYGMNNNKKVIYHPSTSIYGGTQIWTTSEHFTRTCDPYYGQPPPVAFELHDDIYSKIYPSILLHLDSFM